jgi:signal peptidase I
MKILGINFNENIEAPFDFIKENQIKVYDDKIIIYVDDASIGRYAPTGSMKPVLDEGSNGIRIKPESEKDVHIGDIITFREDNYLIIHRVVDIGTDNEGTYFITKGDNNNVVDGKVRFEDIEYITIGMLW